MKVYQAINKVQSALAVTGISKDRTCQQGASFKFRGIDDVFNALSPLLAEHGLCILPRMLARTCEERTSGAGKALFYVTVEAEFDLVAAEDGSRHTIRTFGEAMDSGDKATNKAMSAAYKYAALQAFAIPTEGDNDPDATAHEVAARNQRQPATQDRTAPAKREPDISPEARAKRIRAGVASGDAEGAAAALAGWPEAELNAVWGLLDGATQQKLTASWPK